MASAQLVLLLSVSLAAGASGADVVLGGVFEAADVLGRASFAYAVSRQNQRDSLGPKFRQVALTAPPNDAFQAAQKTCDLVMSRAVAVFGPRAEPGVSQVASICDHKEVPHVGTGPGGAGLASVFSLDLYPPPRAVGKAIASIVSHYQWKSVVILYEDGGGLRELQDLLQLSSSPRGPRLAIRRLPPSGDFKPLLKEIKDRLEEFHMVLHAGLETGRRLLEQAEALEMVGDYYHYIFANLDLYTLDLEAYKAGGCNITGLRLVNPHSEQTRQLVQDLRRLADEKRMLLLPTIGVQTSVAVMMDGVSLVGEVVKRMGADAFLPSGVSCDNDKTWRNGSTFKAELAMVDYHGLTGHIQLDAYGRRRRLDLTVVELGREGFQELGTWNQSQGLNITRNYADSLKEVMETLENKTLRISVYLEVPFVMYKRSEEKLTGNDRYEGYCVDLLREIAALRKFNYSIHEVRDKAYGSKDANGKWNGMVGELQRGEADLALASLTISYSRSEVIDFTVPFMHLGISILFKKPEKKDPSLFTFLSPLSLDVWIYMLAAYVGVSLMLWILARFSPYEWYNPHPCDPDTDVVENQFNLLNSLWFTVGSLMQQGSDIAPRAASTRLVAGIWWFFTLILISSYTANLAAFLTVERMVSPIESADDLAKQTKIKYGTLNRGSTMTFFKESKIQTYERMWAFMEGAQPSVFVNSSREGIVRVKVGDYAYLMESSMLEYYIERDCDLMQIGGLLDSKGYGIGLPKHSPYREPISSAILMLQEKTVLTELKDKWWKQKRGGGKCKGEDSNKGQHNELGLQNVGGVFVLLLGGLVIAFIIGVVEFIYKSNQNAELDKRSLCSEMAQEMQFAMRCHGSKKPARKKHSIVGYVDDGKGTLVPSSTYGDYQAVPTKSDSYLYNS